MRHCFLIVILSLLFLAKAFSQVGPPDLRCLAVAANGDITLTWIAPADPNSSFVSYEIYSSISATGPFSFVVSLPGSIFTTTYTHAGANGHVQSRYYYIYTKYGPGGSIVSGNTDTLKSIFLNILPVTSAIKLSYNQLHQPRLASSSSTFTIYKEYPVGTWTTFATTTGINYNDTLSVCSASMNYYATQLDNSGCLSVSNIQGGVYSDTKNPNEPVIDSISVLSNGNVIIAWYIPRDEDIVKYQLYQVITNTLLTVNMSIDTISGRSNNFYIFSTTGANSGTVGLTVAAIDSCNKISTFTSLPNTIFLKADYNRCAYQTELSWNAYPIMPGGVKEYKVYFSVDGGNFFSLLGVTTDTRYTHSGVSPNKNICYYVRAFNHSYSKSSSSNRACFFSSEVAVPAFVYLRTAYVSGKTSTSLRIFLDTSEVCKGIDIYRSEDGISFDPIGFLPAGNTPDYTYSDTDLDPSRTSYYYRALIKDSCGNTRAQSNTCKTILLKVTNDREQTFIKHLKWSDYEGFSGGTSGYNIYRVVNDKLPTQPVGTAGLMATSYTDNVEDEASNGSKIEYMVEAVEGVGNTYGLQETSVSNYEAIYPEGRIFIPSAFAPKGINKIWKPVTHFIDKLDYHLVIYNRFGNKVFETSDDTAGWDGNDAPMGIYAYLVSYKNSRGEYSEQAGTFLLYE